MSYIVKSKVTLSWELRSTDGFKITEGTETYNFQNLFETVQEAAEIVSEQRTKTIDVQTPEKFKHPEQPREEVQK